MTDIEILENAEEYIGIGYLNGAEYTYMNPCLSKAINRAISALREREERENPKPLTLDELRGMEGQPVWVQSPGIPEYGSWKIVAGVDTVDGERTLYCNGDYTCRDYGKVWHAYRHKPKEEMENENRPD